MDETKKDTTASVVASAENSSESKEETKAKAVVEEKKPAVAESSSEAKDVEVPAKFKKIVEEIEKMSVLELNELVKVFEEKFGVSATATAPASAEGSNEAKEEKSEFAVELVDFGTTKIAVIKAVKEALALGLKDAKDKVDAAPTVLAEGMKKEDAENLKKMVETAGGKVNLK